MAKRIIAIAIIFACTTVAWMILGATILVRTDTQDRTLKERVGQLWGVAQVQTAPSFYYETKRQVQECSIQDNKTITRLQTVVERHDLELDASSVKVNLKLDYRKKGLLWYSTYKVHFSGAYTIANPTNARQSISCNFHLPASQAIYDNVQLQVGKRVVETIRPSGDLITESLELEPGESSPVSISYDSQGLDKWNYCLGSGVCQIKNFVLEMTTNFSDIDFPSGCISPTDESRDGSGWLLTWRYKNLLTGYEIGMDMPKKLNPGPWVSKVTFFAPVSLFLFFFLLFMITTVKEIKLHPMNYFFIGAGFFSFHLLLAYLIDHVPVEVAFPICAVVSVALVISYMRLVVSNRFAYVEVGISQLIYLVLFSYTFFFEQYTGLIITILCIITLFVMMQYTGRIDWNEVFSRNFRPVKPAGE